MKKLLLTYIMVMFSLCTFSQMAFRVVEWGNGVDKKETYSTNEYFMISINDQYLVHMILNDDGSYSDSQFYKIITSTHDDVSDIITITAKSSVSGVIYTYKMIMKDSILYLSKTSPEGTQYAVSDDVGTMKTFK